MNILTVCNEQYSTYIQPFIRSLEYTDLSPVTLYVVDAGMSDSTIKRLTKHRDWCDTVDRLEVIKSNVNTVNAPVHSAEWREVVRLKLTNALKLVQKNVLPLLVIDVDCIFARPMLGDIGSIYSDIAICEMNKHFINMDGHFLKYIACMMYFKNSKSKLFIENSLKIMDVIKGVHIETPSINRELSIQASLGWPEYTMSPLLEYDWCSPEWVQTAKTLHFRSHGTKKTILERVAYVLEKNKEFDYLFDGDLDVYRNRTQ